MTIKRLTPYPTYLILIGVTASADLLVSVIVHVYYLRVAALSLWQLALVGTILAAAQFLFEVPTGVVADSTSRKLSILLGVFLTGISLLIEGSVPRFEVFLVTAVILGLGNSFLSGATTAWIADELGERDVSPVLLRGAQIGQAFGLVAIVASGLLANVSLGLPIIMAGVMNIGLGLFLIAFMPERNVKPVPHESRTSVRALLATTAAGFGLLRRTPALWLLLGVTAAYSLNGEGVGGFWEAHFLNDLGMPLFFGLSDVTWFSVFSIGATLLSIVSTGLTERLLPRIDTPRLLPWLYLLSAGCLLAFAFAPSFGVGLAAFWLMIFVSAPIGPLFDGFLNRFLESGSRATLLSFNSQIGSLGRIIGGLMLGVLASASLRLALVVSALALGVCIWLVRRFAVAKLTQSTETPSP